MSLIFLMRTIWKDISLPPSLEFSLLWKWEDINRFKKTWCNKTASAFEVAKRCEMCKLRPIGASSLTYHNNEQQWSSTTQKKRFLSTFHVQSRLPFITLAWYNDVNMILELLQPFLFLGHVFSMASCPSHIVSIVELPQFYIETVVLRYGRRDEKIWQTTRFKPLFSLLTITLYANANS